MKRLKIIWILHGRVLSWCMVFFVVTMIGVVSFFMDSFERGQFSVVSGQVTCVMPPGEFICEDSTHE